MKYLTKILTRFKQWILSVVIFSHKDKVEYVQYGMCPGFTVWTDRKTCISGHMIIKTTDTKNEISYNMINAVVKICKDENMNTQKTVNTIIDNLKSNDLL